MLKKLNKLVIKIIKIKKILNLNYYINNIKI